MTLTSDIGLLLARELEAFAREVTRFPDDESLWRVVPGVANSGGNLALHVCGNLRHFVGAALGRTGYVRTRSAEFSSRGGTRESVAADLHNTIATVRSVLAGLHEAALDQPMPDAPNGLQVSTRRFLLHLVAHTAFHLGQAGYLRRVLAGEAGASAEPLPLGVLEEHAG